ncbi:MAG: glutamate--tRNA ligase family protein [Phycisphaerales bacterium JB040]
MGDEANVPVKPEKARDDASSRVTRLAPSPTGALHLGNAFSFLLAWGLARSRGWRIVLRIEDLDTPRVKPGAVEQTVDLLRWLGIDWDDGPMLQSLDLTPYSDAMRSLASSGRAYPCDLTRSEIESAASAPQEGSGETVFPRSLRPEPRPRAFEARGGNWRFAVPDEPVEFTDELLGPQRIALPDTIGDFVVWTKRDQPSYQLAVVIDDHRQGVTDIVRGNDLLESAPRQLALARALGLEWAPRYWHTPLVRGTDGLRLAKRHGDTRLATWREQGLDPRRVIALAGLWAGLLPPDSVEPEPMSADEFRDRLDPSRIPDSDVIFDERAQRWLTGC